MLPFARHAGARQGQEVLAFEKAAQMVHGFVPLETRKGLSTLRH